MYTIWAEVGRGDTAESLLVLLSLKKVLATSMFISWSFGFSTHIPFNFPFKPSLCKTDLSYRKGHGDICAKSGSTCRHQDCYSSTSKGPGVWHWEFTASHRQAHPWHCAVNSSAGGALQDMEDRVQRVICCPHGPCMKGPSEWHFPSRCRELGAVTPLRGTEGSGVVVSLQGRAACLLRQRWTLDLIGWESVMYIRITAGCFSLLALCSCDISRHFVTGDS